MSEFESMILASFQGLLVETASRSPTGYLTVPDIAKRIDILPSRGPELASLVNAVLYRVAEIEIANGRPMLTALVVKQDKKSNGIYPGEGFFKCAERLGVFKDTDEKARRQFWKQQFDASHMQYMLPTAKVS